MHGFLPAAEKPAGVSSPLQKSVVGDSVLKGYDFTACGKTPLESHEVSGHDLQTAEKYKGWSKKRQGTTLQAAEKCKWWSKKCQGTTLQAAEKMQMVEQEVSGHDFSRAASATKQMMGFSP